MTNEPAELARRLSNIQNKLRREMFEELKEYQDDIETVFDPDSYSPLVNDLREKYLTRLYLIQGVIQQLAQFSLGRHKPSTRVASVEAENRADLVRQVNVRLQQLNGARVMDVKFIPGGDEGWTALITYETNPFTAEADETAAWM